MTAGKGGWTQSDLDWSEGGGGDPAADGENGEEAVAATDGEDGEERTMRSLGSCDVWRTKLKFLCEKRSYLFVFSLKLVFMFS